MSKILTMKNIKKSYYLEDNEQMILNGIDFTVYKGDFVTILGPSGSGKSTLMNIIGCLDSPTEGEYILNNVKVEDMEEVELSKIRNKDIGFVFQQFQLLPNLTALQNVELPLIYAGVNEKERRKNAIEMLSKLGLAEKTMNRPNQLSGGQQQRVAIARALVTNPTIILADEPTGALDQKIGTQIMEIFKQLHNDGKTIIMITHDEQIATCGSRIVRILDGNLKQEE